METIAKRVFHSPAEKLQLDWANLVRLEADAFWADVQRTVAEDRQTGARQALVYLHGYNVTFENAALRAAQIGVDLKFQGILAFYSWPSRGKMTGYIHDEASSDAAEPYLEEFLSRFAEESGAERIHALAHSMGNRAFLGWCSGSRDVRTARRARRSSSVRSCSPHRVWTPRCLNDGPRHCRKWPSVRSYTSLPGTGR